ncbi:unnamed protein product [Callosobruchus maculatus]|uniref:Phospholipid-transporting ATPase n=1 Tax=Callosobruchus maculatus TaxID=64391 RepID=A0A653CNY2_CALMS|nr:unnamed protein product [Callosobruchus maculatus]
MGSVYRRSSDLALIFDQIEQDLVILGASGIEDELQEGVPETIASLREATINLWVLTGDKQQTAINIGYSSKLLDHSMKLIIMNHTSYREARHTLTDRMQDLATDTWRGMDLALVIDGKTLSLVLSPRLKDMFIKLCLYCKVVICCRVSPIQKSEVVENVRKHTKAVTLAIGDGANDVAMIRKAHVGIGISGSEGNHATAASDYTIAQFKYLERLLFIHGAWSYLRISKVILFFFYKNLTFNLIQLWFTLEHEHSGINMFERWSIGLYNVIFTALQPIVLGIFDRPITAKQTLKNPIAYTYSQRGGLLNVPSFMYWLFVSFTQSLLLYHLTVEMSKHNALWSEPTYSTYHIIPGCFIYTYLVIVVNLESGRFSDSWPRLMHVTIWTSIIGWFLYLTGYSFLWFILGKGIKMVQICKVLYSAVPFWLGMFIIPLITLLPDFLVHMAQRTWFSNVLDRLRMSEAAQRLNRQRFFNSIYFFVMLGGANKWKLHQPLATDNTDITVNTDIM